MEDIASNRYFLPKLSDIPPRVYLESAGHEQHWIEEVKTPSYGAFCSTKAASMTRETAFVRQFAFPSLFHEHVCVLRRKLGLSVF